MRLCETYCHNAQYAVASEATGLAAKGVVVQGEGAAKR